MMGFFRKKGKSEKSEVPDQARQVKPNLVKPESNKVRRSKVDEKIIRTGPDDGFVWYEES